MPATYTFEEYRMCLADLIGRSIDCAGKKAHNVVKIKKTMPLILFTIFQLVLGPLASCNLKLKSNT